MSGERDSQRQGGSESIWPPAQLTSKVWKVSRATGVKNCTQINDGLNLIFKSDLRCQANF